MYVHCLGLMCACTQYINYIDFCVVFIRVQDDKDKELAEEVLPTDYSEVVSDVSERLPALNKMQNLKDELEKIKVDVPCAICNILLTEFMIIVY